MQPCIDCPADSNPIVTANRLAILADRRTPEAINDYCATETRQGGCSKFARCQLHPDHLKDIAIAEVEEHYPADYERLKQLGCLRPLVHEHRAAFQRGDLTLGDFIGAPRSEQRNGSQAANLIAKHPCPLNGCAVPEMAELHEDRPTDVKSETGSETGQRPDGTAYHRSCPVGRVRTSAGPVINQTRLLACELTRKEFRDFQRRYGIESIAPIAIVPGSYDVVREVIYLGKEPYAAYQYLSWLDEVPFPDVRLLAPKIVRHLTADESGTPWSFGNKNPTLASFLINPATASRFEVEQQVRYIPAGEFMFLLLAWLWSGERRRPRDLRTRRAVVLESVMDIPRTPGRRADLLFHALRKRGFGSDLERLFGLQVGNADEVIRIASRAEDFELLGLIRQNDGGIEVTERGQCLVRWLVEVEEFLRADVNVSSEPSVISPSRLVALIGPNSTTADISRLRSAIVTLRDAAGKRSGERWCAALVSVLNQLPRGGAVGTSGRIIESNKWQGRRNQLRDDVFPVYPIVHLTVLAGYEQPLDWLAVPLGGPIVPATPEVPQPPPQAGAFVLFRAGGVADPRRVINALRPVLSVPAFVDGAKWIHEVIGRKQAVVDLVTMMLARGHEASDVASLLEFAASPRTRLAKLVGVMKHRTRRQNLSVAIGKAISFAKLAELDQQFASVIRRRDWVLLRTKLSLGGMLRDTWRVLSTRAEAVGKSLDAQPGVAEVLVIAPEMALFHLIYEALLNVLRRSDSAKTRVRIEVDQQNSLLIWNPAALFTKDFFRMLRSAQSNRARARRGVAAAGATIRGVDVMLVLADIVGCALDWRNEIHPDTGMKTGVLRMTFQELITGGDL